jgi:hypothetical protein
LPEIISILSQTTDRIRSVNAKSPTDPLAFKALSYGHCSNRLVSSAPILVLGIWDIPSEFHKQSLSQIRNDFRTVT